jgi:hypothetical protein
MDVIFMQVFTLRKEYIQISYQNSGDMVLPVKLVQLEGTSITMIILQI